MSKAYIITETKPMTYSYLVYATSEAEAMRKFNSHEDYIEVGLDTASSGRTVIKIRSRGQAIEKCAVCNLEFSPENVSDYRCDSCKGEK